VPAVTVEQVVDLGLPSTPLKETEKRASGWKTRYGVEQTEIDALATLRPDELRRIVRRAVAPYWDAGLEIVPVGLGINGKPKRNGCSKPRSTPSRWRACGLKPSRQSTISGLALLN
jgi:hypothetical protein